MLSDPLTLDKLLIVILLLVPGFISMRTWALIVPSRHRSYPESLIDIFTYGLLNYLLLFWLIKHIAAALSSDSHPALLSLAVIMYGFVFPALWPILWWVARKFSAVSTMGPPPTTQGLGLRLRTAQGHVDLGPPQEREYDWRSIRCRIFRINLPG